METGTTSATLYVQERPNNAGPLPTSDVNKIRVGAISPEGGTSPVGTFATPWEPLVNTPYIEENGARRDTWLSPRVLADNAAGVEIRSYVLEVGILDWV